MSFRAQLRNGTPDYSTEIVMAYVVLAHIVMAYVVMAHMGMPI